MGFRAPSSRKGMRLKFRSQVVDIEWQHKRRRGHLRELREELSFLVNSYLIPGIGLTGDRDLVLVKAHILHALRCASDDP